MEIEEKVKKIDEFVSKEYLYISPFCIIGGATLVSNCEELELYEKMAENTAKFSEKEIVDLILEAKKNNKEAIKSLDFNLIYCGGMSDLPDDFDNPSTFILNNKDNKIVALYRYLIGSETREFFCGFSQSEKINKYGYIYINLMDLFEIFKANNVGYEIDRASNKSTPAMYRDDSLTSFKISYNPEKHIEDNKQYIKTQN